MAWRFSIYVLLPFTTKKQISLLIISPFGRRSSPVTTTTMAEKRLKARLYRILRSVPLRSCKSKDQISDDVVSTHLLSPEAKIPLLSPEAEMSGRKCPPASPIIYDFPMQKKKKKKSKARFMYKKRDRAFPDCKYVVNGLFCSSEEEEEEIAERVQAVVKRSSDPYSDFRSSMVDMIVENNIFSAIDLENLLLSFLSLNSYHHHNLIIQVFAEIWEAFFFSNLN